jgi:predicted nicotinamide N-methyase
MTDGTPALPSFAHLADLHGDALDAALARGFTVASEEVTVGSGDAARVVVLHKPQNADHLITEADYVIDERLPYWADLWPSARVLANTLIAETGAGRRLLELGCGLGLDTVAAMAAGFEVTATDYYEQAIHMTRANAARNLGREPAVRMVNWRHWPDDLGQFDVVMAADVLYEREYATLVAQCLARSLAPEGVAIIADPGRLALPAFREALPTNGLELVATATVPYSDHVVKQQVQVMRIRHQPR